jgi:hypothetical protein
MKVIQHSNTVMVEDVIKKVRSDKRSQRSASLDGGRHFGTSQMTMHTTPHKWLSESCLEVFSILFFFWDSILWELLMGCIDIDAYARALAHKMYYAVQPSTCRTTLKDMTIDQLINQLANGK